MSVPPRLVALSPGTLTPPDPGSISTPGSMSAGSPPGAASVLSPAAVRFLAGARAALGAGLPGLCLREPGLPDGPYLQLAEALAAACAETGAWLALHDRVHLAPGRAQAVHLGFRSLAPRTARALLATCDAACAIGLSSHADDDAARWAEADHLVHGPVRPTPSKEGWKEPIGFDGLADACARASRPVLAIGGMRPDDVAPALAAGAHGVAVLGGIFGAHAPAEAVARYTAALAAEGFA